LLATPVLEIDKKVRETETRYKAVVDAISQLESVIYSKQDASAHNKEVLTKLKQVEERLVSRLGALEDGKGEQGTEELLKGIKLIMDTKYTLEMEERGGSRPEEQNRERVTLEVLVDELEATDVSVDGILKAIRKRETVIAQRYELERRELTEKHEYRIAMLNKANKEMTEKLESRIIREP
jgi:hypothetical protein